MKRRVRRQPKSAIADEADVRQASFADRLRILVGRSGSVLALAQAAEVSDSSVHLWLGGSEPSREKLVRLADAAGSRSIGWRPAAVQCAPTSSRRIRPVRRYKGESGVEYHGVDFLALKKDWIQSLPGSPIADALFLMEADGDAMARYIQSGDLILMNTSDRDLRDGVWALMALIAGLTEISLSGIPRILLRRIRAEGGGKLPAVP